VVAGQDEYGNDTLSFTEVQVGPCSVQQTTSREAINFTDQVATSVLVFMPYGTDVGFLDAMIINDVEYEVTGDPTDWVSPFSGHTAPIRVTGQLVKGASQ
jgi:ketosteroid isomerase-like protein